MYSYAPCDVTKFNFERVTITSPLLIAIVDMIYIHVSVLFVPVHYVFT